MSDSQESTFRRLLKDLVAGLINGVASVPSGMATAALAGVNPVYGLYAVTVAPAVGALLASSQLMQIATNGAAALTAREGIDGVAGIARPQTLFLLVALAGAFLVLFGLFRAGRLLRFVSFPVMTAFLSGVATVLVMDQTAKLFGYESGRPTNLGRFVDLILNLPEVSVSSAVVGGVALVIIVGLTRTPLNNVASVIGLVVPPILAAVWKPDDVTLVRDVSEIPQGFPPLGIPDLSLLSFDVVTSAFALAVIIAVQGAGISQSYENPDGTKPDPSRDMLAQGEANVAGSLVSGMPTGASLGQTELAASTGARTRRTGVVHSLCMLAIILVAPGLVSLVPVPALAAVMIVAGFSAVRFDAMAFVWRTRGPARVVLVLTFLATLLVSIAVAVALGVVSAVVLYVASSVSRVRVNALEPRDDGRIHVTDVPQKLADESITVIDVYGSLFFAGARRLRELLPEPEGSKRSVVILRLRGNSQVGATLIDVINEYAHALAAGGGRLFLCGMEEQVSERLKRAERLELHDEVAIFPATGVLRDSTKQAVDAANEYLRDRREDGADTLVWPD